MLANVSPKMQFVPVLQGFLRLRRSVMLGAVNPRYTSTNLGVRSSNLFGRAIFFQRFSGSLPDPISLDEIASVAVRVPSCPACK